MPYFSKFSNAVWTLAAVLWYAKVPQFASCAQHTRLSAPHGILSGCEWKHLRPCLSLLLSRIAPRSIFFAYPSVWDCVSSQIKYYYMYVCLRNFESVTLVARWRVHFRVCLAIFLLAQLPPKRGVLVHKNSLASYQRCSHSVEPRAWTCPFNQSNLSAWSYPNL